MRGRMDNLDQRPGARRRMARCEPVVLQIHNMTDKWGRRLFTAGGVLLALFGLMHSLSLFNEPVGTNDTERQLLDMAANYKFNILGSLRSMAQLERGFSIAFMLSVFGVGALDLLL